MRRLLLYDAAHSPLRLRLFAQGGTHVEFLQVDRLVWMLVRDERVLLCDDAAYELVCICTAQQRAAAAANLQKARQSATRPS